MSKIAGIVTVLFVYSEIEGKEWIFNIYENEDGAINAGNNFVNARINWDTASFRIQSFCVQKGK